MVKYYCIVIFLISSMIACDSSTRTVQSGEVVNIFSNTLTSADRQLFTSFERSSGVKVNIISDTGEHIIKRLVQQDSMLADLILLEGIAYLQQAKQAGLLDTLPQGSIVNAIPSHLRDSNLQWLSIGYSANIIGYLPDSVDTLQVRRYTDLTDAQWKGKVGWGTKKKAFYQSQLAAMLAEQGEKATAEWLNGITQNLFDTTNYHSAKLFAISDSSAWLSILNTAEYAQSIRINNTNAKPPGLIFPSPEAYLHITGIGIAHEAPHTASARALFTYLFSREVMQQFATARYLYPTRSDVESPVSIRNLGLLSADTTSQTTIARFTDDTERLLNNSGWR